jgi:hypothetical protein
MLASRPNGEGLGLLVYEWTDPQDNSSSDEDDQAVRLAHSPKVTANQDAIVLDSFRRWVDIAFPVDDYLGASVCGKTRRFSDTSSSLLHVVQKIGWNPIADPMWR